MSIGTAIGRGDLSKMEMPHKPNFKEPVPLGACWSSPEVTCTLVSGKPAIILWADQIAFLERNTLNGLCCT